MKNYKGFIGPLGDDIPSIFPIVFAILLFAGTVLYANDIIAQKARALEIREGALALSYLVTEKGYTSDTEFSKACSDKIQQRAGSLSVKFLVTLKRFCNGIPSTFDYETVNNVRPPRDHTDLNPYYPDVAKTSQFYIPSGSGSSAVGSTWAYCTNDPAVKDYASSHPDTIMPQPKDVVLLSYPIAVPCPDVDSFTRGLGVINVMTWK